MNLKSNYNCTDMKLKTITYYYNLLPHSESFNIYLNYSLVKILFGKQLLKIGLSKNSMTLSAAVSNTPKYY